MYEPVTNSGNNRTHAVFDSESEGSDTDDADHATDLSSTSRLISPEWFAFVLNRVFFAIYK